MGKFDNKVVVITGSGQGIGRCLALTYAKEGAHVGKYDLTNLQTPPAKLIIK